MRYALSGLLVLTTLTACQTRAVMPPVAPPLGAGPVATLGEGARMVGVTAMAPHVAAAWMDAGRRPMVAFSRDNGAHFDEARPLVLDPTIGVDDPQLELRLAFSAGAGGDRMRPVLTLLLWMPGQSEERRLRLMRSTDLGDTFLAVDPRTTHDRGACGQPVLRASELGSLWAAWRECDTDALVAGEVDAEGRWHERVRVNEAHAGACEPALSVVEPSSAVVAWVRSHAGVDDVVLAALDTRQGMARPIVPLPIPADQACSSLADAVAADAQEDAHVLWASAIDTADRAVRYQRVRPGGRFDPPVILGVSDRESSPRTTFDVGAGVISAWMQPSGGRIALRQVVPAHHGDPLVLMTLLVGEGAAEAPLVARLHGGVLVAWVDTVQRVRASVVGLEDLCMAPAVPKESAHASTS